MFLDRNAITTHVLECHNAPKSRCKNSEIKDAELNAICAHCDQVFSNKRCLRRHIAAIHALDKPYRCTTCGATFVRQDYLVRHRRRHTKKYIKERYTCSTCGISYKEKCNLYKHMTKIHSGKLPFSCSICGASFMRKDYLTKHSLRHIEEKMYFCTMCSRSFRDKSSLRDHVTIHTGNKPFVCSTCGRAFRIRKILKRHELRHTGEKPFKCVECEASFSRKYILTDHSKKVICSECQHEFTCNGNYRLHMKEEHDVPLRGKRASNFKNEKIQLDIKTEQIFDFSNTDTNEKNFVCCTCGKDYAKESGLSRHILLHTGHCDYICALCEAPFNKRYPFISHIKNHKKSEYTVKFDFCNLDKGLMIYENNSRMCDENAI